MADFLLIHGAWHGAWCWRDLLPLLRDAGYEARAIDLPGHGADPTPAGEVTLADYGRAVAEALDPARRTILVGHSMGGYPITAAAELVPERIAKLVYLCAYVPAPGMNMLDHRAAAPRLMLADAVIMAPDRRSSTVDPTKLAEKFYHDCPAGTVEYAAVHLCPQPAAPQKETVELSARSGTLERHYIRCRDDRAIDPAYQVTMTRDWPPACVHELATAHSPFFADPAALARTLDKIARQV